MADSVRVSNLESSYYHRSLVNGGRMKMLIKQTQLEVLKDGEHASWEGEKKFFLWSANWRTLALVEQKVGFLLVSLGSSVLYELHIMAFVLWKRTELIKSTERFWLALLLEVLEREKPREITKI